MAVMEDGDFEIQGVLLKGSLDYPIYVHQFDPGKTTHRDQDVYNPLDDTLMMGKDFIGPPTWEFKLGMGDFTPGVALQSLGELMKVWRSPERQPDRVTPLKYMIGGRVRQVFGRPRPFSFNPDMLVHVGYATSVAAFQLQDALHYDVEEQRVRLQSLPVSGGGGFMVPFKAPILTSPGSARNGMVTNRGSAPAPFTARINGPQVNPGLVGDGWELKLDTTIREGEWVEIDTRARTVTHSGGGNLGGSLSRSSRLLSARLKPGSSEVVFKGTDPSGISSVDITWFDAYLEH